MGTPSRPSREAASSRSSPRVVLVDDDPVFRARLHHVLAAEGVEIAGEAANGEEAIGLARELAPDVVLMDVNMPVLDGVRATGRIATLAPEVAVVILTVSADERDVVDAILAGACGYLLKDCRVAELVAGITAAAEGDSLLSARIAAQLLRRVRGEPSTTGAEQLSDDLTARELEILSLLAAGKENSEIAAALYLSPKTVKNNVTRILKKLQLRNRIEAAVYATKRGLA